MNAFLRKAKELRTIQDPLLIVLGNESCDLDSAISAIALAYFYAQSPSTLLPALRQHLRPDRIVPVLNVPRRLLPAKTEVAYFLRQQHIDLDSVLCRDEINNSTLERAHFILVDHHVSKFANRTVQVIDHRPVDAVGAAALPANCAKRIETVGSCSTLIADMILADRAHRALPCHDELLRLLHPVIVLDTVNFSESADRTRPLDRDVCARIESADAPLHDGRQREYDALVQARADVSALDALQLLHKDMKLVQRTGAAMGMTLNVALPGMPIALRQFAAMPAAAESVTQLANEFECSVVVLLSMVLDAANVVHREVAVIRTADTERAQRLQASVLQELQASQSKLDLVEQIEPKVAFLDGMFFTQRNVKASRKQVLPIVQSVVNAF